MYTSRLSDLLKLFHRKIPNTSTRSVLLIGHRRFCGKYSSYSRRIGVWFKEQSIQVTRSCTKQFEFILAQRIRRSLQLTHLYSKLWDEKALKEFMKLWRYRLGRNTKEFLMGAAGVTIFNWDEERISEEELYSYSGEIDAIHKLRDATVVCNVCHLRLVIDNPYPNIKYCKCDHSESTCAIINDENADPDWEPFIERQDMLVWKKVEANTSGLYAYKVFGTFSDVTAEEFLQVQVDVDYRKVWDSTAKELKIIDTDPKSLSENHRNDVIYWEMIWPRLFSNRDYVYQRRWVLDKEKGIILIVSRAVSHPNAPNRPDTYRVTSYWSYMVIRPCTNFNEPGIEFGLTYFDDPGVNIPSAVTAWVAMSGLPDFLCRMRLAAKEYKQYTNLLICQDDKPHDVESIKEDEEKKSTIIHDRKNDESIQREQDETTNVEIRMNNNNDIKIENSDEKSSMVVNDNSNVEAEENEIEISSDQAPEKQHGLLRYFFLTKIFA